MATRFVAIARVAGVLVIPILAACSGGGSSPAPVTVGGTVSGLAGSGLVLADNGTDHVAVSGNGTFVFASKISNGDTYSVSVQAQPTNPSQACTVGNGTGHASNDNVTNVVVACTTNTYTVGGTVSGLTGTGLVLANNDGNSLPINRDGTFVFAAPIASGSTYKVTIPAEPSGAPENCTVGNARGTVTNANVTSVTVNCERVGRFLYVSTTDISGLAQVWAFSIDAATGMLTPVAGSPYFTAYAIPGTMAIDPSGRFLYVVYGRTTGGVTPTDDIVAFAIDATSGVLMPVPGSPFAAGSSPISIAVEPGGRYAYVASEDDGTVIGFAISPLTGALTPVNGSPVAAGPTSRRSIAVDPGAKFVYVASANESIVSVYALDAATGALSPAPGGAYPTAQGPTDLAVHPSGTFVYVANAVAESVSVFGVNSATGTLSAVVGSPFATGVPRAVDGITAIALGGHGSFAYVPAQAIGTGEGLISALAIDQQDSALTPVPGSPFATSGDPVHLAIDPSSKFAYVADYLAPTLLHGYVIDATTGALATLPSAVTSSGIIIPASLVILK
jgi:6-phosphogluconolactonase